MIWLEGHHGTRKAFDLWAEIKDLSAGAEVVQLHPVALAKAVCPDFTPIAHLEGSLQVSARTLQIGS